jgi:hypothetical protein
LSTITGLLAFEAAALLPVASDALAAAIFIATVPSPH